MIWILGLSGSGKTSVGKKLYEIVKNYQPNTVFLDGDLLREVWEEDLGHDIEGRYKNAHRISHLTRLLDAQGINVIAAVLSIFLEWQKWNRENFSSYFEVFLDTSMETILSRDSKGLYKKAMSGKQKNVVGVDIAFPKPPNPDLVIQDGKSLDHIVHEIIDRLSIRDDSVSLVSLSNKEKRAL